MTEKRLDACIEKIEKKLGMSITPPSNEATDESHETWEEWGDEQDKKVFPERVPQCEDTGDTIIVCFLYW